MHDTALISAHSFGKAYVAAGQTVLDIGGANVNGSPRAHYEAQGIKYICVDMDGENGVDVIVAPGGPLPFADGSVDAVISTSCFEHDPCFWMTFKEMCRVVKPSGFVYVNAPANGSYHQYPGDNWRFYGDAGQALAVWSGRSIAGETVFPVKVIESFSILPLRDGWVDFVCVWQRSDVAPTDIVLPLTADVHGPLRTFLGSQGLSTVFKYAGSR